MVYAPTAIDLSRLPPPNAIEELDRQAYIAQFKARFLEAWTEQQDIDPTLPDYDTFDIPSNKTRVVAEAFAFARTLDRSRVNDGFRALLAHLSKGSDLDAVAASRNIERQTIVPASSGVAAIMEGDASLLRRYLLSFDAPAAGSAGRYLFDALKAWPQSEDKAIGLWDARVNGYAVHGRRGDIDLVVVGPLGAVPTTAQILTVRNAVTDINRAPEGVAITVLGAVRAEYAVSLVIEVPQVGPAPEIIRAEALARVNAAAKERLLIGGEIPAGFLAGAAYGPNIIKVRDLAPVLIEPDPYKIPVMTAVEVTVEVR